jgi:alpha-L-fucosidase
VPPWSTIFLLVGGLALVLGILRGPRAATMFGCGCVLAAALLFAGDRTGAAVSPAGVSQAGLAHARRAYFARTIARSLPRQLALVRNLDVPGSRRDSLRWFRHARLGLFIHYGPTTRFAAASDRVWWHAVDGGRFDVAARTFAPKPAAVSDWVALAKRLGAEYITVTAKHHDGFGLWDSRLTGWDVGPHADLLRPLARLCRRNHIRLFVYYSLLDLHEPTYAVDKDAYALYVEGQLRELLTEYGPLAGVWLDGWNREFGTKRLERLYRLVHSLQPWALVATNHHRRPLPGEDFRTFEERFPRDAEGGVREVAVKLGPAWFWSGPSAHIRFERLPALLARAEAKHANLLVDVPPRPDGRIDVPVTPLRH